MRKLAFWLLPFAAGIVAAHAAAAPAPADTAAVLSSVDYNFVAQANLGAPFQIDSGRIAEQKGTTPALRDYAHLMVVSQMTSSNFEGCWTGNSAGVAPRKMRSTYTAARK
jgi:predicted outer membrane protein